MNIDEENDVFAGPGVNLADEDFNDYPEAFQMMPVGGYFKVGDDPCEIPEEGESGVYLHKHIVQMYKIPSYVLQTIVPMEDEENPEIPTDIYLFDVPNGRPPYLALFPASPFSALLSHIPSLLLDKAHTPFSLIFLVILEFS